VDLREVEARKKLKDDKLAAAEAALLRGAMPDGATMIAMDGGGRALSSADFAKRLGRWRDDGIADLAFVIGGANGLHRQLVNEAHFTLSFGAMTWPHLLARAMLMEQLYRAHAILMGHPYHRA
jgi:23S rRNA (pseudouridine1915-N3)-methyltransferase